MHEIKINRALRQAKVGAFPASRYDMLLHVPDSAIARLTSSELAELLDAFWACANKSKRLGEEDIVREGAIWDARKSRMREIAA